MIITREKGGISALFFYINIEMIMNRIILILLLFIYSCSDRGEEIAFSIDNKTVTTAALFDDLDSASFFNQSNQVRRQRLRDYAAKTIMVDLATTMGLDTVKQVVNGIRKKQNDYISNLVFKRYITPSATSDSLVGSVLQKLKVKRGVHEVLISHALSLGPNKKQSPVEARAKAYRVYRRLSAGKLTFEEAISIYAELPFLKMRKGNLGNLAYGEMPKNYCDVIWQSEPGLILPPIETKFGFHIVQTGGYLDANKSFTMEEVKNEIGKGKFDIFENALALFPGPILNHYGVHIDTTALFNYWKIVEEKYSPNVKNRILFMDIIQNTNYDHLFSVKGEQYGTQRLIRMANGIPHIPESEIAIGYSFFKAIVDVLNRYYIEKWMLETDQVQQTDLDSIKKAAMREELVKAYYNREKEKDPAITIDILKNRILFNKELTIAPGLLKN